MAKCVLYSACLFHLLIQSVLAGSYLTGGSSPACWKTSPGERSPTEVPCDIVDFSFVSAPPATWEERETQVVEYRFTISNEHVVPMTVNRGGKYHIVHTNLHSCFSSAGVCTPFVSNTPGLSTHTPETYLNLTASVCMDRCLAF